MTVATFIESVHSSLRNMSQIGADVISRNPDQRDAMTKQVVDALRRQLVATNNLRASCESHLASVNRFKAEAISVSYLFA